MYQSEEISELAKSLVKFQNTLEGVEKNSSNPYFKSKYADLHTVWQAIRIPLTDNGLCVTQTVQHMDGKEYLVTTLLHISGQWVRSCMPIITSKGDIQSFGGALTYCKRYALQAICGCSSYDDDGNEAAKEAKPAKKEATKFTIKDLYKALSEFEEEDILDYIKFLSLSNRMNEEDVVQKILEVDESFVNFREKLKIRVRLDKKPCS